MGTEGHRPAIQMGYNGPPPCPKCKHRGSVPDPHREWWQVWRRIECDHCGGEGRGYPVKPPASGVPPVVMSQLTNAATSQQPTKIIADDGSVIGTVFPKKFAMDKVELTNITLNGKKWVAVPDEPADVSEVLPENKPRKIDLSE